MVTKEGKVLYILPISNRYRSDIDIAEVKTMEYESFIGLVRDAGNGSLVVTLPSRLVTFAGFEKGDQVKIMIKKE